MSGLVADYGSSSESESEEQQNPQKEELNDSTDSASAQFVNAPPKVQQLPSINPKKLKKEKLANPLRNKKSKKLFSETTSVFYNPFHKDQEAKKLVLEKHVKMTVNPKDMMEINGKKICWNYRKGRCKFGHNCKYAHDSDLVGEERKPNQPPDETSPQSNYNSIAGNNVQISRDGTFEEETKKRKIRAGLSEGLKPNKKSQKLFKNLQQKERPWVTDG